MDLILYSKVPFTKEYNVVVNDWTIKTGNNKTALQLLLDDKKYRTFTSIDYYLTFPSGQIIIDKAIYNGDYAITEYNIVNYLSFTIYESTIKHQGVIPQVLHVGCLTKGEYLPYNVYAFVDKISMVNDCYVIDYTIDYMHTYMTQITNIRSHVIRWNQQRYYNRTGTLKYPKLACDYNYKSLDGNIYKYYNLTSKTFKDDFTSYKFRAFVQLQLYDLNAQGEQTDRDIYLTEVSAQTGNTIINDTLDGIIATLNFLFLHQGDINYKFLGKYYQIMHIYLLNENLIDPNFSTTAGIRYQNVFGTNKDLVIMYIDSQKFTVSYFFNNVQYTNVLANLQHIKSFGTMSHQIEFQYDNNNLVNKIELTTIVDGFSFNIYLKYKDITLNITNDFEIFYPYTVNDASAREIDKFTRQYTEKQIDLKEGKTTIGLIGGVAGSVLSIGAGAVTGSILGAVAGAGGLVGTLINGLFASEDIKNQREKNNAQLYSTNSMSVISADNFLNVYYGLVFNFLNNSTFADGQTTYDSIINFDDVNFEIEDSGFKCDFMMDYDTLMNNTEAMSKVLYLKGNETTIDGYFDNETNQILTAIFNKGFKLYNSQNYTKINKIV